MIVFPCHVCKTSLTAEQSDAGQLLRCPTCLTTVRVPLPQAATTPSSRPFAGVAGAAGASGTAAAAPSVSRYIPPQQRVSGKRYGFNCGYCSSRLEATESMAAQEGQCPTCGNQITIPILDRYNRLIDPKTRQIIKQDPHPVHAYAAAGERAPKIIRSPDGRQFIVCPRCSASTTITANNCKSCGMPFTMEGTTLESSGANNGFCVASLVLGILGIPSFFCGISWILAIIFGIVGLFQVSRNESSGGRGMAIAGIVCGVIGGIVAFLWYHS